MRVLLSVCVSLCLCVHVGYPNNFGALKNTPSRVATTDTANIRWSQLGAMPTVPNPTLGKRTFTAMTYDLADGAERRRFWRRCLQTRGAMIDHLPR